MCQCDTWQWHLDWLRSCHLAVMTSGHRVILSVIQPYKWRCVHVSFFGCEDKKNSFLWLLIFYSIRKKSWIWNIFKGQMANIITNRQSCSSWEDDLFENQYVDNDQCMLNSSMKQNSEKYMILNFLHCNQRHSLLLNLFYTESRTFTFWESFSSSKCETKLSDSTQLSGSNFTLKRTFQGELKTIVKFSELAFIGIFTSIRQNCVLFLSLRSTLDKECLPNLM